MLEPSELKVTIDGKEFKLKITLGFWKRCGFKREEARIIESNPEVYASALKLAIFYGNKNDFGWTSSDDMSKMVSDDQIDSLDEDYSAKLSYAMVHYLPKKLRDLTIKKMKEAEEGMDKLLNDAIDGSDKDDQSEEKKS